ncbi:MAG TPA: class I SAM-dependent methyltransferase [Thermoleophilaceae bacterium]
MGTPTRTREQDALGIREQDALGREQDALGTYESFAPFYDSFTSDYPYDEWLGDLEAWARECGLAGKRLLDVACGTGNSFMPMLERGYEVTACDLSPSMAARAKSKAGDRARVTVADMRSLPWRSAFDLVTCVDDSMNYLLSTMDLVAALRSMRDALAPRGLVVFDTNSLAVYRNGFTSEMSLEADGTRFLFRGEAEPKMAPGRQAAATIELVVPGADPLPICRHVQRHHPVATVLAACADAGLRVHGVRGAAPEGGLDPAPDELRHQKIVFMASRTK